MDAGPSLLPFVVISTQYTTEGRSMSEVAHLASARSQRLGNGISGDTYYILQYRAAAVMLFTAATFVCIVNKAMIIYIK